MDVWRVLQDVIHGEKTSEFGEFSFEFCKASDIFSEDEFSFANFLSADFVRQHFVLVSKERKTSASEDNEEHATPTSPKDRPNQANGYSTPEQPKKQKNESVWGSPLKCDLEGDTNIPSLDLSQSSNPGLGVVKKQEPKRLGIPLNWARKVVSAFNLNVSHPINSGLPSVVVLCDGENQHSMAIMGTEIFPVHQATREAKGFKTVTVTVDEKGSLKEWNSSIKVGKELSQPQSCRAVYKVNTGPGGRKDLCGTVILEIKWKETTRLLEIPPLEASTDIKASVYSGSPQSGVYSYYQELQFLSSIIGALTTGEMEWVSSSTDKPTISLNASVANLITTLQEEGTLAIDVAEEDAEAWTVTTAVKTFSIVKRTDYDFTDRLWKVMLNCTSTVDLVSSLRLVFSALGSGRLQPYVDNHNQTTVAHMVRDTLTGSIRAPGLSGANSILFLAEIGAEKLRKDYIHLFLSQGLATMFTLESFTAVDRELQAKLDDLEKLHNTLEMATMLYIYLHLPTETLGTIVQQMLSHFRHNPVNPQHEFTFYVKTSEVRGVLASTPPSLWSVETSKKVEVAGVDKHESSLHCLCASQPFSHLHARSKEQADGNSEKFSAIGDLQGQYCLVQRKEKVVVL